MMKRIEFSLNLDDPADAALYDVLAGLLRHRRAGTVIRQALAAFLLAGQPISTPVPQQRPPLSPLTLVRHTEAEEPGEDATERILEQSAAMFGF